MKQYLLIISLFFIVQFSSAQEFQIQLQLDSACNKEVFLAHYYLDNIYIDDTIQIDATGAGLLNRDTLLPEGLYKIYLNEKNHFDFLMGSDQKLSISNKSFSAQSIEISGAVESEEFADYMLFLKNKQDKGAELKKMLEVASEEEKSKILEDLNQLTPELQGYWFNISDKYPNTFLSKFLLANYVPLLDIFSLPDEIQKNDSLLLLARFDYQREHFWDYFDYTDERFLYTPLLKPKMETWFTKVLYQNYDSVQPAVFAFIEEVRSNKRIFQFACSWFLNSSINSNILGMDALFVDLAQSYYLNGQAFWASEESLKTIRENVLFMQGNLIGKIAPDLTLENFDGEFVNLHKIDSKITAVLIYEPNCSHCKVFVPEFYNDIYQKYKDKSFQVFAIYSMDNKEEWSDFLLKENLFEWINVWDENHSTQFKILYDARKTPGVYLLDENKRIIAKKLTIKQIAKILENTL